MSGKIVLGYVVILLLLLMPNLSICNQLSNLKGSTPQFQHDLSALEVVNRVGGSPSDAIPLGNWLIIAVVDRLEVRSSTFEILSELVLPLPAAELDTLENGDLVVTLQPEGLALVSVSESGNLQLLDHYEEGTWTGLDAGDGIFCAWLDYREFQLFHITNDEIKHGSIFQGLDFIVDGSRVVWTGSYYYIMDTSISDSPIPFELTEVWGTVEFLEMKGDLLFWNERRAMSPFFPKSFLANISQVLEGGAPVRLGSIMDGMQQVVAWSSNYIYLKYTGFIAVMNVTNYDEIGWFGFPTYSQYSRIPSYDAISSNNLSFVCIGLNFIEWWNIIDPYPSLILERYFPGYLTDVVVAQDVLDPIVLKAFDVGDPAAQREFGYPFVSSDTYPIIADVVDLKMVDSHVYEFTSDYPEILFEPRMDPQLIGLDTEEYPHPTAESLVYDGLFYRIQHFKVPWSLGQGRWHNVLFRWDPANLSVATELLRFRSYSKQEYYLRHLQDRFYLTGDAKTLIAINLDTLNREISGVELGSSPKIMRAYEDLLFVLDEAGISMFDRRSDWSVSIDLEFSSRINISADVFEVHSNWIYAANATHLMKLSYDTTGDLHYEESIQLPTLLHRPPGADEVEEQEPGELLIYPKRNCIYRTAGTYGMWIVHDSAMNVLDATSTTETTPATTPATPYAPSGFDLLLVLLGGISGFGMVIVIFFLLRNLDRLSYSRH
ncbi:MAG: hypothetical protein ACW985_07090 [Candidatus Thorarchaeota archaeon]